MNMISIIKEEENYLIKQQHKINLFCIKRSKFTNNNDIKVKYEIDGTIYLYYY